MIRRKFALDQYRQCFFLNVFDLQLFESTPESAGAKPMDTAGQLYAGQLRQEQISKTIAF